MTHRLAARAPLFALLALAPVAALAAGCGGPTIEVSTPFAVVAVLPSDGAVGIDPFVEPSVAFNRAAAADIEDHLTLRADGTALTAAASLSDGGKRVVLIPDDELPTGAVTLTIDATAAAADGTTLGIDVAATFTVGP